MLGGVVATCAHLIWRIGGAGFDAFVVTALAVYVCFQVFNLFDAVVLDLWLVIFRPKFAAIPGTENAAGFRDPKWHLRNYLVGLVIGIPVALVAASLAWWFRI